MQENELTALLRELGRLIHVAAHDGFYDFAKEPWQQQVDEIDSLWQQLTHPKHIEALRHRLDCLSSSPRLTDESTRLCKEALRQAEQRATGSQPPPPQS